MLTKSQIQRIAQRNSVGMQVQERDCLQHLPLWHLYRRTQMLNFKGGTALRLVYQEVPSPQQPILGRPRLQWS